ncbi:uncharacterized protein MONOS_5853 [Monocercomonoides exilis]|uniref:uncharacterized protein n=1 Tax=Monocercomonoides exilis TaxID=2049356 RepID=UPI00355A3258|nr:hypothetical protein MONOS_5853 [Monocercomonoides exilis]|eukprot:MONOS_5853.1-p1 / transcript=MONOS_5853.1 / gene=MONOS_5853 / organism=Monocercomonoides_exilis_PA203 / gene_product=unspecified product / transcript_product=unspecified product / location=Mono_scaffold00176:29257-29472(+) / protein_length=72 / sequence_SO=supercontig / SO=protein_coding / is_pseudo=false
MVKLKDEVIMREAVEIAEKGQSEAGLRIEDVVLSPAVIALAVPKCELIERNVMGMRPKACIQRHTESLWKE